MSSWRRVRRSSLGGLLILALSPAAIVAQESKSAPLVKELVTLLEQAKIESLAARDPAQADQFVAALYFPGTLLVVSARYSVPVLLNEKLAKKSYREVYIDLNSASVRETKVFIEDLGADGLQARREENRPFDAYESGTTRIAFDSDWKRQKLSEEDYRKAFGAADDKYTRILSALLAEIKKSS